MYLAYVKARFLVSSSLEAHCHASWGDNGYYNDESITSMINNIKSDFQNAVRNDIMDKLFITIKYLIAKDLNN